MSAEFEIIFYAILAGLACAMLYSVLGRKTGHHPETMDLPELGADSKIVELDVPNPEQGFEGDIAAGLKAIREADPAFTPAIFLDGAKAAYNMILEAFADGDRDTLKTLLADDVYDAYADAIKDRESRGLTQVTDLARLAKADIVEASLRKNKARITVDFASDMATALKNEAGEIVEGDLDILSHVDENWTFERDMKSKDPNWLLIDVTPTDA